MQKSNKFNSEKNKQNLSKLKGLANIIDIHAHIFPDQIAEKAIKSIGDFYNIEMSGNGKADNLIAAIDKASISKAVVFSTATSLNQVESINSFLSIQQSANSRMIAFGTLHPLQSAIEINNTLAKIDSLGLKGIKLHPDFQKMAADSDFVMEVCSQVGGKYPVLLHAGDHRYDLSHPYRIRNLAEKRPECRIIAAHFGGWSQWKEAVEQLSGLDHVYVDTSSTFPFMEDQSILGLIDKFGSNRVLFGSDFPMWQPYDELIRLSSLDIPQNDLEAIVCYNAASLLDISLRSSST